MRPISKTRVLRVVQSNRGWGVVLNVFEEVQPYGVYIMKTEHNPNFIISMFNNYMYGTAGQIGTTWR